VGYNERDRNIDLSDLSYAKDGDKEAFRRIVERYKKWAYEVAYSFIGDSMTAYDISQKAFVRVWKNLYKWDKKKGFRSWFYTILRNLCYNYERDTAHRGEQELIEAFYTAAESADKEILETEMIRQVWAALDKIPHEQREIVVLVDIRNMKYQEVADLLDIPIGTVMSRLYYARKKLADILRPFMEGEL